MSSSQVNVAFFGAGSFVFGPTLIAQCVLENRISGLSWNLYDPNFEAVATMAKIGRRMADSIGVQAEFAACDDRDAALDGVDFVVCSAAVDVNRRFAIDLEIVNRVCPGELVSEFGGITGIASSLRQMTMIADIAQRMKRNCPGAWLLDISNPLPRVCQAAHDAGAKTVGFCSVSVAGLGKLHEIFNGVRTEYPFHEAQQRFEVEMGGTNHLSWLVALRNKSTGADLMPELRRRLEERKSTVRSKCEEYGRRTGYMLMPGDGHVQDFLPIEGLEHSIQAVTHGNQAERDARVLRLKDVAEGRTEISSLENNPSWERPSDFIQAMTQGIDASFTSLNLVNEGQIRNLPLGAFVETGASISGSTLRADRLTLPESVLPYSRSAVEINLTLAGAFQRKSLADLHKTVDLDPTIIDKDLAMTALHECLIAHKDVIGAYS